jgi:hypothetical protein
MTHQETEESSNFLLLLNDPAKIAESSDVELSSAIANILTLSSTNQKSAGITTQNLSSPTFVFPSISLDTVLALVKKIASGPESSNNNNNNDPVSFFCQEQLKVQITTYFSTAAKFLPNLSFVDTWFTTITSTATTTSNENSINTIVSLLLKTLSQESHSLVSGEILRLFIHCSPTFLRAFLLFNSNVYNSNNNTSTSQFLLFEETSLGKIVPMLTDTNALKNHAAWQVMFAILENDLTTHRPSRFVVEYLSKNHLHSFLNHVLIASLRHSNPVSRRFTLRFISDMIQAFGDWSPISHCVLQSPAIFYALLANAEGPACPEHWQVYHIIKMFITFPNKCPLMRHLCFINRDALGQYAQSCATKFSVYPGETTTILTKLAAMTPLSAEELALIQTNL